MVEKGISEEKTFKLRSEGQEKRSIIIKDEDSLVVTAIVLGGQERCYYPHFTKEQIEAQ